MNSRDITKCNKCGEPLRSGICSDQVDCLLDRVAKADIPIRVGRTHLGKLAFSCDDYRRANA
jgi:hypothetical protein